MDDQRRGPLLNPRRARIAGLALAAGLLLAASAGEARVFRRWGLGGSGEAEAAVAYRSAIRINGGRASLQVWGWQRDFDTVVARLRGTLFAGQENRLAAGDGLAFGTIRKGGSVVRLLIADLGERCVGFRIEQTEAEFEQSKRPPAEPQLRVAGVYPGSVPVLLAEDEDRETVLEVLRAPADVDTVRTALDASAKANGWAPCMPAARAGGAPPLGLYARGSELCCVTVRASDNDGKCVVSVLHHRRN